MPVEDHDVHPMVSIDEAKPYGCSNAVKSDGYLAHPWSAQGPKFIPFRMSKECRYDMSLKDPRCSQCKSRGLGEAYDKRIRESGK